MTDAQIEAIARAYCVKRGLDPDAVLADWPLWLRQTRRVRAATSRTALAMRAAIDEVLGNTEGKG